MCFSHEPFCLHEKLFMVNNFKWKMSSCGKRNGREEKEGKRGPMVSRLDLFIGLNWADNVAHKMRE